ncbi:hypothetical protein D3C85_1623840 [compost metagenome]
MVAITFRALISPEKLVIFRLANCFFVFKASFKRIPFSRPIQTAGIGISFPVTEAVPVSSTPFFTPLIMMIPLAPYLVAIAAFSERCREGVFAGDPGKTPR